MAIGGGGVTEWNAYGSPKGQVTMPTEKMRRVAHLCDRVLDALLPADLEKTNMLEALEALASAMLVILNHEPHAAPGAFEQIAEKMRQRVNQRAPPAN